MEPYEDGRGGVARTRQSMTQGRLHLRTSVISRNSVRTPTLKISPVFSSHLHQLTKTHAAPSVDRDSHWKSTTGNDGPNVNTGKTTGLGEKPSSSTAYRPVLSFFQPCYLVSHIHSCIFHYYKWRRAYISQLWNVSSATTQFYILRQPNNTITQPSFPRRTIGAQ